jgi:hypothetical protein
MTEEGLRITRVPRSLELAAKLFGFEVGDVLIVFMYLSMMNLVLGELRFRAPLIWGSTVLLAMFLYFIKIGKPDHYIQHLTEYMLAPNIRSASGPDTKFKSFQFKGSNNGKS